MISKNKNIPVFLLLTLLLLAGCRQDTGHVQHPLSHKSPLSLAWNSSLSSEGIKKKCEEDLQILEKILTKPEHDRWIGICQTQQVEMVYLPKSEISAPFDDGAVSVVTDGTGTPLQYSYHFLHELHPTRESMEKKRAKSDLLQKDLVKLYGQPVLTGEFSELETFGFVPDPAKNSCKFWKVEKVAILLCSERIIYMDGFEMSLSYTRLSGSHHGQRYESFIDSQLYPNLPPNSTEPKKVSPGNQRNHIRTLEEWLAPLPKNCEKTGLLELHTAWNIPASRKKILESSFADYEGENLTQYIFENQEMLIDDSAILSNDRDLLYIIKTAADQGSGSAMNEIGISLMYCFLGVKQNIEEGRKWIEMAIEKDNPIAMLNKANDILNSQPISVRNRDETIQYLQTCQKIDPIACKNEIEAVNYFLQKD